MSVLVVGGGYLGLRAATRWRDENQEVFVVTRSSENAERLRAMNLNPIVADITVPDSLNQLPTTSTVLFAVGFDRSRYQDIREVYVTGFNHVLQRLSAKTEQLIYISTTGVYGNSEGAWIDEETTPEPTRPGGRACLEAEQLIADSHLASQATVLRLAGIYGPGRIPHLAAVQAGDWAKLPSSGYINLIHVDDAVGVVNQLAANPIPGETFIVADGQPPMRQAFYNYIAAHQGLGPIDWTLIPAATTGRSGGSKRVRNRKLLQQLAYTFMFPDYQAGLNASLPSQATDK